MFARNTKPHIRFAGDYIIAPPRAVSWGPSRIDVFSIAADRSLVHKVWDGKAWSRFKKIGGVCLRIDAAVSRSVNRIDVFYRGVDDTSYHKWFDGSNWYPSTEGAESLGLPSDTSMSSIIPITGAQTDDPKEFLQVRRDINDLHAHFKEQFDLYIRAVSNLQAKPETASLSWYGISSKSSNDFSAWMRYFDIFQPSMAFPTFVGHLRTRSSLKIMKPDIVVTGGP